MNFPPFQDDEPVEEENVVAEDIATGAVDFSVALRYIRAGNRWPILLLFAVFCFIAQLISSGTDYWLSYW